jgi:rhamnulose-1-phosphate aldolase
MDNLKMLPAPVTSVLNDVSRIAEYLWNKEWAERNAGNISIDVSEFFKSEDIEEGSRFFPFTMPEEAANLTLLVTGAGCYLRSLINGIAEAACIIRINSDASGYSIIWGGHSAGFRPTSELISHIIIHCFNRKNRPSHKAVLHTHPMELIVLSHHELFRDEHKFNHSLWKMCPEIRVYVPKGIFCAPYKLTGSFELADVTMEGLKSRDVVLWEKHGALATGETIEKAFDFLDVANKGAKMLLMAWSAGFEPAGLTVQEMKELEKFIMD